MNQAAGLANLLERTQRAIGDGSFVKLTLGAYRGSDPTLRNVFVRPVALRAGRQLQFVYRHATRDLTKNLATDAALHEIDQLLNQEFASAHLFTTAFTADWKRSARRLKLGKPQHAAPADTRHDRAKHRLIDPAAPWLQALGASPDKIRQIDKFVEILKGLVGVCENRGTDLLPVHGTLRLLDMGCGKGYLTFAAYEWLTKNGWPATQATGIEARADLVDLCNRIAETCGCTGLGFVAGQIGTYPTEGIDVLVALHACDTATDDALAQGIRAGASMMIVAPCCHKEVRPQLQPPPVLRTALRHGIWCERQAEFVTDALRAALLEWAGYDTKVFEFISTEHTAKNLMITATRNAQTRLGPLAERARRSPSTPPKVEHDLPARSAESLGPPSANAALQIRDLARFYGIRHQRLATQLGFVL